MPSVCDNASQSNTTVQNSGTHSKGPDGEGEAESSKDDTMEVDCDISTDQSSMEGSATVNEEKEQSVEEIRADKLAEDTAIQDKEEEVPNSPTDATNNNKSAVGDSNSNNNTDKASNCALPTDSEPAGGESVPAGQVADGDLQGKPTPPQTTDLDRPKDLAVPVTNKADAKPEDPESYSSFNFWRHPLPVIELDDELLSPTSGERTGVSVSDIQLQDWTTC